MRSFIYHYHLISKSKFELRAYLSQLHLGLLSGSSEVDSKSLLTSQRKDFHKNTITFCFNRNLKVTSNPHDKESIDIVRKDIGNLYKEIREELGSRKAVRNIANYYFDGNGKALRPLIALLMAKAVNHHQQKGHETLHAQREIAKITEMIHTSSLLHDDIIDGADTRRGKATVHSVFTHRKAVFTGDFILSVAANMLAKLKNEYVTSLLSQVLVDLVQGEFMQLNAKDDENERFPHYLRKTFNKTASLIAVSCKAIAILAGSEETIQEAAFQFGRNCGIAFQLIDDMLDFTSSVQAMGKPNLNDLKAGLATAPVLFACEKFPELNSMILRQFRRPKDVTNAVNFVLESDGLERTKVLAYKHCQDAILHISLLKPSPEQRCLIRLTDDIINRKK